MADTKLLALQARMLALQARGEALKWANVQDSNGAAYTPDHFFAIASELLEVAATFAAAADMKENAEGAILARHEAAIRERMNAYQRTQAPGWRAVVHECEQCIAAIRAVSGVHPSSNDQRQVRKDNQGLGEPGRLSPSAAGAPKGLAE